MPRIIVWVSNNSTLSSTRLTKPVEKEPGVQQVMKNHRRMLQHRTSGSRLHTLAREASTLQGVVRYQVLTGRVSRPGRWQACIYFQWLQDRSRYPSPGRTGVLADELMKRPLSFSICTTIVGINRSGSHAFSGFFTVCDRSNAPVINHGRIRRCVLNDESFVIEGTLLRHMAQIVRLIMKHQR
jgi:hypothetical protein